MENWKHFWKVGSINSYFQSSKSASKSASNLPSAHHCAYVLSICDILLNPKSLGIKCNDKSVARQVNAFIVNIFAGKTTLKYFVYIKYIYLAAYQ